MVDSLPHASGGEGGFGVSPVNRKISKRGCDDESASAKTYKCMQRENGTIQKQDLSKYTKRALRGN